MNLFVCSDVHGNVRALDAVLAIYRDLSPCHFLFLGDCIGYGIHPDACLDRILALPEASYAMGNHEWAFLHTGERENMTEAAARMLNWSEELLIGRYDDVIREKFVMTIEEDGYCAAHASPVRADEWPYLISEFWTDDVFRDADFEICFVGHTHIPALFSLEGGQKRFTEGEPISLRRSDRYIINPGSVGQPRDGDPRAACCFFDSGSGTVTLFRCEYDVEATVHDYEQAGVPEYLSYRLLSGI